MPKPQNLDLTNAVWVKALASGPNCDNCVEATAVADHVVVRDSKDPTGPTLTFTQGEWDAHLQGAAAGEMTYDALVAAAA